MSTKGYIWSIVRISLLVFFSLLFSNYIHAQQISCRLTIEKYIYLTGENVMFEFEIINNGANLREVYYPILGQQEIFKLEVVDDKGKFYRYKGFPLSEGKPEKRTVQAGDIVQVQNSISGWYGDRDALNQEVGILSAGKYYVRAIYRPLGQDSIMSNKVEFTVVNPTGDEVKAFELWRQTFYIVAGTEYERVIELLKQLIDAHPTSAYRPGAFPRLILSLIMVGDTTNARKYLQKLLNLYPNSIFSWQGVLGYAWKMNKKERIALYEEISQKYPGTRIGNTLIREIPKVRIWER